MLNQVVLVGRLTKDIEVSETENGGKFATITLAIPRSFKNSEGVYDTDFIECVTFDNIAENTAEYCGKGDIIGVKGRLQNYTSEKEGEKTFKLNIVAEKVTFLSTHPKDKEMAESSKDSQDER